MPNISNLFFRTAVVFLIVGIGIGLQMSISQNHNTIGAHAHINLLGWVTSALFGGYYALNPAKAERRLALIHYGVYTVGVIIMGFAVSAAAGQYRDGAHRGGQLADYLRRRADLRLDRLHACRHDAAPHADPCLSDALPGRLSITAGQSLFAKR